MVKLKSIINSNRAINIKFNPQTTKNAVTQTKSALEEVSKKAKVTTREPMLPAVRNSGLQATQPQKPLVFEGQFREVNPRQQLSSSKHQLPSPKKEYTADELRVAREQLNKERSDFLLDKRKYERYERPLETARQRRDAGLFPKQEEAPVDKVDSRFRKAVLYGTGTLAAGTGLVAGVAYGAHSLVYPEGRDQARY